MKRILIIHSSSRAFPCALDFYNSLFDAPRIDILTTSRGSSSRESLKEKGNLILFPAETFDLEDVGNEFLRDLRENGYDRVVVLFNKIEETCYANVEDLARRIGARVIEGFDRYERRHSLIGFGGWKLMVKRRLNQLLMLILGGMCRGLLLVIFLPGLIFRSIKDRTMSLFIFTQSDSNSNG